MLKFVKMDKKKKAKHVEDARKNQIAICRSKQDSYIVTNEETGKAYRVYDLRVEIDGTDVTEFMPGHKYGNLKNVDSTIERARRFWKKEHKTWKFEDLN